MWSDRLFRSKHPVSKDDASIPDIPVLAMSTTTIRTHLVRILPPLLQNHLLFLGRTRVLRRLWRLTGRLTRYQGSALDDAACASMHVHGRAGKPKQLARNAKNPGKTFGFAAERTGTELFYVFPMVLKGSKGNEDSWSPKKKYDAPSSLSGSSQPCFMLLSGVHHTKNKNLKLSNVVEDDEWKSGNRPVP